MSPTADKIIRDISNLPEEEQDEVFWALAEQKSREGVANFPLPQQAEIDQVLLNRIQGPFTPINTPEQRADFFNEIHRRVNQNLGYQLFEDA